MRTTHAIFYINHKVSHSRVGVEFVMKNGKVHLNGVSFVRGQVIPLNAVRECMRRAKDILKGDPEIPFTG